MLAGASLSPARDADVSRIVVSGTPVKVFDHATDQQENDNVPDAQVTAWREADGVVNLMIPDTEAYRMRGPDLAHLRIDPHKIFSSTVSASDVRESAHDYSHWFMGPYSFDGRTFYTLAHSEWYACLLDDECERPTSNGIPARINGWVNSLDSFVSADGGATWRRNDVGGSHVVGSPGHRWTGSAAFGRKVFLRAFNHSGLFQPTRVVREGNYFYAIAFYLHRDFARIAATGQDAAPVDAAGYVLFRTTDLTDPHDWQVWSGGARFARWGSGNPDVFLPRRHGAPLNAAPPQIIYDTHVHRYVLIHTLYGGRNPVYYMTTKTLANPAWSDARPISGTAELRTDVAGEVRGFNDANFPSIIDPGSLGFNFEFTEGKPWLFFVTAARGEGDVDLARDVYRVELSFEYR
jgi:hypothetical protein